MQEGKGQDPAKGTCLQHVVLILWLLATTAFGLQSIPILVEATQVHISPFLCGFLLCQITFLAQN